MVSRRAYKRVKVNSLDRERLSSTAKLEKSAVLGLDIAKHEIVACIRWPSGEFDRPWSIANSSEIKDLVTICQELVKDGLDLKVAMESTGTYGDAVRYAFTTAKIAVVRVSGKGVSDYKEIFDGVPSQHDGKDAAIIAELTSLGKATRWPYELGSEFQSEVAYLVHRMDAYQDEYIQWQGRLESQLARFWPELSGITKPRNITTLKLLLEYGSASAVAKSDGAATKLLAWGRGKLSEARIETIVKSAATTSGIPTSDHDVKWIQEICQRIIAAKNGIRLGEKQLKSLLEMAVTNGASVAAKN